NASRTDRFPGTAVVAPNEIESDSTATLRLAVATFEHCRDNQPVKLALEWHQLADLLSQHARRAQKDGRMWSPTRYRDGATRSSDGVEELCALVLDFDHDEPPWDRLAQYEHIAHTTHSHPPHAPKWRVVLPLARPVPGGEWPGAWRRASESFGGKMDLAAKDSSRAYYLPSCPPDGTPDVRRQAGAFLDIEILPPVPEPEYRRVHP